MVMWGLSGLSHDASLAVVDGSRLIFAAHSERYSRVKGDPRIVPDMIDEALRYGRPECLVWYEKPLLKKLRHAYAGQWKDAISSRDLPIRYLRSLMLPFRIPDIEFVGHHASHAAAGYATSEFDDAAVIVADSIGEFATMSIGRMSASNRFEVMHTTSYPDSLGLLYSAFTRRCGLMANEDEYILMGMSALGEACYVDQIYSELVEVQAPGFRLKVNPHRGIGDWMSGARLVDLAASIQVVLEKILVNAAVWARKHSGSSNLVLGGGVALNCAANSRIVRESGFDNVWIFPNPGDAGSSVGAVAALTGSKLEWDGPYLGTNVAGEYPVDELIDELSATGIAGVVNGRAEFGPRALGNRSLLADPRPLNMKDRINDIKGRERFRPFAPVVRSERAATLFEMPLAKSPYMQFVAPCRFPDRFASIKHFDGTSRVQTVDRASHEGLYELLAAWEDKTGCPMLLNTSLNVRGEPLVNTRAQGYEFARGTGVRVL